MAETPRILVFAGSTRAASFNKKLAGVAARAAEDAGADVTRIDLRDLVMPLYDGDLEAADGLPDNAQTFKDAMVAHDGFLIASPEYNGLISAVLKNAIDWASRPQPDEPPAVAFRGQVAGIMAASPGGLGGLRGLVHLRQLLTNLGVLVVPDQIAIAKAGQAFTEDGALADAAQQASVAAIAERVCRTISKLSA
jgi:NAD(P)H-dependent FMN reductase